MLRYPSGVLFKLATVAMLCGFGAMRSRAFQAPNSSDQKVYSFIRSFLLAAYPELPVSKCTWQITISSPMDRTPDAVGDVDATVIGPVYVPTSNHVTQVFFQPLLGALFEVNQSRQIEQVMIHGEWTSSEEWEKIVNVVNAHPGWSDARAVQALMKAGAKYGPDQKKALLNKMPTAGLSELLGVNLSLQSLVFSATNGGRLGSFALLEWIASFEGHVNGQTIKYAANFEPFGGRLTFLLRVPPKDRISPLK
jgi:hypothetical protein